MSFELNSNQCVLFLSLRGVPMYRDDAAIPRLLHCIRNDHFMSF